MGRPLVFLLLLAQPLAGCASLGRALYEGDRDARRDDIGFVERTVAVGDHEVEFLERAGEGVPLLLVHGFGGSKDSWNMFAAQLPRDRRVLSPSLPGFGRSTHRADASYDFAAQADRLAAYLDRLGVERAHVVGVSMGGAVAATFAARHPERTQTLTAFCPAGITPPTPTAFQTTWRAGDNTLIVRRPEDYDPHLDLLVHGELPDIPAPVRAHLIEEALEQAPRLKKLDQDMRDVPGWLEGVVPDIKAPTLVVWGIHDEVLHYSGATLFEQLEGVRIELRDDCGHACIYFKAVETAASLTEHVRAHETGAGRR